MKRFMQGMVALGLLMGLSLLAQAQVAVSPVVPDEAQQIDTAEIARRIAMGLNVQSVGGIQASDADAIGAVAAPPADDTHKWFVSVVCNGNQASERLKRDWKACMTGAGNDLKNIAVPGNTRASWAHFNIYEMSDPYQAWRDKRWAIKKFPAIIIQAPASGQYGPEGEIVCQFEDYEGDPAKLYKQMSAWIAKRALKYHHASYGIGKKEEVAAKKEGHQSSTEASHEEAPCPLPYAPTPPQSYPPAGPMWVQPELPPQPPAAPASPPSDNSWSVTTIVLAILAFLGISGSALATVIGVVLIAMSIWRGMRKATGQSTLLSDASYETVKKELEDLKAKLKATA